MPTCNCEPLEELPLELDDEELLDELEELLELDELLELEELLLPDEDELLELEELLELDELLELEELPELEEFELLPPVPPQAVSRPSTSNRARGREKIAVCVMLSPPVPDRKYRSR